eukprot:1161810-Pelagomonas_calceolata.AAC.8
MLVPGKCKAWVRNVPLCKSTPNQCSKQGSKARVDLPGRLPMHSATEPLRSGTPGMVWHCGTVAIQRLCTTALCDAAGLWH